MKCRECESAMDKTSRLEKEFLCPFCGVRLLIRERGVRLLTRRRELLWLIPVHPFPGIWDRTS